jgi:hypothetical protein
MISSETLVHPRCLGGASDLVSQAGQEEDDPSDNLIHRISSSALTTNQRTWDKYGLGTWRQV